MSVKSNNPYSTIITGTGSAAPDRVLTNRDLENMVETSDEWIVSRTGIRERRILDRAFSAVDLSEQAARAALEAAGLSPEEVDLIIVATVTPDHPTPSNACLLQARLQANRAAAMDISAGCTGFTYALTTAHQFVCGGSCRNALVVGTEVLTRVTDWEDRGTCVLFGDGSGAVVLQPAPEGRGLIDYTLRSDGRGAELLLIPAGGSAMPATAETVAQRLHTVKMNGNEIFKFAARVVEESLQELLQGNGFQPSDLKALFLHQANLRIIEHIRKRLKLKPENVPVNIDRYGNTSSASIPILLDEEVRAGRITEGDLVSMIAFGAGLTWGGVLMRW